MNLASLISFSLLILGSSVSHASLTPQAIALQQFLATQKVDQLWLPNSYVEWKSGATITPTEEEVETQKLPYTSHCSAYVASLAMRLAITLLNPETSRHGNSLLANHQNAWLNSNDANTDGWNETTVDHAEALANQGEFVVASIQNQNPKKPGHIAIVVPDDTLTLQQLQTSGPTITQAGSPSVKVPTGNALRTDTVSGFYLHTHGSLNGIQFFYHDIPSAR